MKCYYKSPLGIILIEGDETGITSLAFVDNIEDEEYRAGEMTSHTKTLTKSQTGSAGNEKVIKYEMTSQGVGTNEMTSQCIIQLNEYFNHKREIFNLKLHLKGTEFQKKIWEELLKIPFGKAISYKELSARIGNLKAIRAIAAANGANPVSIIVPCHRVIGSDGSLTGYAGGLWRKRWLLDFERNDLLFATEEFIISLSVSPQPSSP